MLVEYWSDFTCPFCYIAETRMKKALKEVGLEKETRIVFKAFELNPMASKVPKRNIVEGFAHHYGMSMEEARRNVERICEMGRSEGLEFNYGTAHASNTFDALRLAKLAQSKGNDLGNDLVGRMYKAFFGENLFLADHAVLEGIAEEAGMDMAEVKGVLEGEAFSKEVLDDEREARMYGIDAVPFFAINGKYGIPGAVDIGDMKKVLLRAYDEEEAESVAPGMVCGPDGCRPADK